MKQYTLENGTLACIYSYAEGLYEAMKTWAMLRNADMEIDEVNEEIRVLQRNDDEFTKNLKSPITIITKLYFKTQS